MSALVDRDAERAFLAACFGEPTYAGTAGVMPHEMTGPRAAILAAVLTVTSRGEALDTVGVRSELARRGQADRCTDELLEATNAIAVPSPALPRRIRELAKARSSRDAALRAVALYDQGRLEDGASELRQAVGDDVAEGEATSLSMADVITRGVELVFARSQQRENGGRVALTTGIRSLDIALGDAPHGRAPVLAGWEPGDYVVIGGDTNAGKSSLAMHMAFSAARSGVRVGVVQIEDPIARVGSRALSMATAIPQFALRSGDLSMKQWERVAAAAHDLADLPIRFEFEIAASLPSVCAAIRRLVRKHGCEVVILDYIQAVQADEDPRLAARDVIAETKREASHGERPAVVIALSQFRKRQDETTRPSRGDLYESAYIAQKAEHIVLLWKDAAGTLNCVLDKTKDGKTGAQWQMVRDPDTGQLSDNADAWEGQ